jgi:starch phosphorylase
VGAGVPDVPGAARLVSATPRAVHPAPGRVLQHGTRAGNVFTTHTPVAAGFDTFSPDLVARYLGAYARELGLALDRLLALGREDGSHRDAPFNMALLAMRGSGHVNGVSQLHGEVSRHLVRGLYPRWPEREVPVGHVTNGVHASSWDSAEADALWTTAGGRGCWRGTLDALPEAIGCAPDEAVWRVRTEARRALVEFVRARLLRQEREHDADPGAAAAASDALDPAVLTLGFARRFAAYKRPTLLLADPDRLIRLLTHPERPVQLVVAGKAHPHDEEGKRLIQAFVRFAREPAVRRRVVFLADYDMAVAERLVQGVDVWLNTPRRPWEACGTSGMKVLVNGGLNLSELDGWWAEAYAPHLGWALGDGREHAEPAWDAEEARQLYDLLLEREVVPEFYDRDRRGIPVRWLQRICASLARLAPRFSANRMLREYVERVYRPATDRYRQRVTEGARGARELEAWQQALDAHWAEVRVGDRRVRREGDRWHFDVEVAPGGLDPGVIQVELYADPVDGEAAVRVPMTPGQSVTGSPGLLVYGGSVPAHRPAEHFTPRVVPFHPAAVVPLEAPHIRWPR